MYIRARITEDASMSLASSYGTISVSIDADASSCRLAISAEAIDSVVVELFDRFQKQRVPATWVVGNPLRSTLTERVARSSIHEIALSGGSEIAAHSTGGAIGRLLQCRRAGLGISTITENPTWQPRDIDLLAKHGITVIRKIRSSGRGVESVRYGVWHVSASVALGGSWMPYFAQLPLLKRTIEQAIRELGICHLRIDAASIARGDVASGLRAVERFLRHLDHLKTVRGIAAETLHETALRLQPKRTVAAARSILRAA
jgi:hypothetical protein